LENQAIAQGQQAFYCPGECRDTRMGTNIPVGVTDFEGLKKAILDNQIDLVVVGPEVPLCEGLTDFI
jgi:phosphoribosylamine--glycine ligase